MANEDRLVGDAASFDAENLARVRRERGIGGGVNLEKALWALEYAAQLGEAGLDFVLKGGTAVQLVTDPAWPRFSVDVDICTEATREELEEVLSTVSGGFEPGFEFDPRRGGRLDTPSFTSYEIATPPIDGPPRRILLDAHLSLPGYMTEATPLRSFFYDSSASVTTPTTGALLGDKLTTIPSRTVGRRIRDSRQGLDYSKHVFDVQRLARSGADPGHVKDAFETVVGDQNRLRGTEFGLDEVVGDLVVTCQAASTIVNPQGWSPVWSPPLAHELEYLQRIFGRGVRDLRPLLTGEVIFGEDEFVTAAGEAALIAMSTPSGRDIERTIAAIGEGAYTKRSVEDSTGMLGEADAEKRWFIDMEGGLYSRSALGTWSEVVRRSTEG